MKNDLNCDSKNEIRTFYTDQSDVGTRLDVFLTGETEDISRSSLQKLIERENVLVNQKATSKHYKLRENDVISIQLPNPVELEVLPQNIPLSIVYEDNDLLVVNKQKGMVVHPAVGHSNDTLVNALLFHCADSLSGINGVLRPGIIHRIDKNTSGLLIVAKNDKAHRFLAEQIQAHSFLREYEAVVYGNVKEDCGCLNFPIGRSLSDRKKMCVYANQSSGSSGSAKAAITHYTVIQRYRDFTHIKCRLETGRTHQIRVHLSYIGHPVAGDDVYGPKKVIAKLDGQCLHARSIGFIHPETGEQLLFESELPEYFRNFLASLQ